MYNFAENPTINISRSRFKMKHSHKTTFNAGKLVPIEVTECSPGDTWKRNMASVIRMNNPIKPTMDNLWADIYHFFVPMRLLWKHWKEFQGESKSTPWTQKTEYTIPQIKAPTNGWVKGTIADHMGLPINVPNISVSHLPIRAYTLIWNEFFRDQNLQTYTYFTDGDETTQGENLNYGAIRGGDLSSVAKPHDYFTSCLPEPQKGDDVLLPIGNIAPVNFYNGTDQTFIEKQFRGSPEWMYTTVSGIDANVPTGNIATRSSSPEANNRSDSINVESNVTPSDISHIGISNAYADLTEATAASINNLRQAFQLQKMLEKDARGGTRYVEILKNHFGVTASDQRLQRPEYLGGHRVPIQIEQVVQTSETTDTSPQGNTSGYSWTSNKKENCFTKSIEEHGYIITLACIRTHHSYQQGINKMWSRLTRTDFYMPIFANLGEQPVLNKEIYAQGNEEDEEVFGYNEAWAEYRTKPDIITGEFRSNWNPTEEGSVNLDIWHYADFFTSLPTLGNDFIKETTVNIDRTIQVPSTINDQFIADFYFEDIATRPMPVRSIPGLTGHH